MISSTEEKINSFQICRGVAIIFILLSHSAIFVNGSYNLRIFATSAASFVFVFFILSGFVIFYRKRNLIGKVQKIPAYLIERVIKIYPLYWIYFAFSILIMLALPFLFKNVLVLYTTMIPFTYIDIIKNFFLYPYFLYPCELYPPSFGLSKWPILPVAWYLSYQMLLYVGYIFFILNKKVGLIIFSCWSVIIVLYCCGTFQSSNHFIKFLLNPIIILFFIGLLAANIVLFFGNYFKKLCKFFLVTGITCLLLFWIFVYGDYFNFRYINKMYLYGLPYVLIIFGVALWEKYYWKDNIQHHKIFSLGVYIGDASYSIYLSHYWILFLIYYFLGLFERYAIIHQFLNYTYITYSLVSLITLCIGLLCYELIEKPLLRKMKRMFLSSKINTYSSHGETNV